MFLFSQSFHLIPKIVIHMDLKFQLRQNSQALENNLEVLIIKPFQAHPHNHQVSPKKQIIPPFLQKQDTLHLHITWPIFQDNHQFVQVLHSKLTLSQTCQYFVFSFQYEIPKYSKLAKQRMQHQEFSSLQRPSIFIFNIFFFIQNNTRH